VDFTNTLYQVDPVTGAGTALGYLGFPFVADQMSFGNSLAGDGSRLLLHVRRSGYRSFLYSLIGEWPRHSDRPDRDIRIGGSGFVGGTLYAFEGVITDNQTFRLNLTTGRRDASWALTMWVGEHLRGVSATTGTSYLGFLRDAVAMIAGGIVAGRLVRSSRKAYRTRERSGSGYYENTAKQISFEIPDELAAALAPPGQDPIRAALETLGLEAYRERRLTAIKLRTLLGIDSRLDVRQLPQKSIGSEKYTIQDFEQDSP